MTAVNKTNSWIIFPTIAILTPLVIIFTIVRVLMTPLMLEIEYRMPGFPADSYGFTLDERLKWSKISMDYLLSNNTIDYFDLYSLGEGIPLYNQRELSHMEDVKHLVSAGRVVWLAILCMFVASTIVSYLTDHLKSWYRGIRLGGYFTLGLIFLLLLSTFMDFNALFTQFHALFFTGDSWIFYYSDTFIRLFPIRFWMDLFIYIGVFSALIGFGAIRLGTKNLSAE